MRCKTVHNPKSYLVALSLMLACEPMCYAQMGGMICATFITLLLVPVIYSIFVLDLKIIKWEGAGEPNTEVHQPDAAGNDEPTLHKTHTT